MSSESGDVAPADEPTESTDVATSDEQPGRIVDSLTLRFDGKSPDGTRLHELRAEHVAEVLQGLVGITDDFEKAGVFHSEGPAGSELLVRPARRGSFEIEVIRVAGDALQIADHALTVANDFLEANGPVLGVTGVPTIGAIITWATKSARVDVKSAVHDKEAGLTQITWQDGTMNEVPTAAWVELNKRDRRRKKQLRQIMAGFADPRVESLEVAVAPAVEGEPAPEVLELGRSDYDAVRPDNEVHETTRKFNIEAQMSAVNFDDASKWKVKTKKGRARSAVMKDKDFLKKIAAGEAIRKDDIFQLRIHETIKTKDGRKRTEWTIKKVKSHRRTAGDSDS